MSQPGNVAARPRRRLPVLLAAGAVVLGTVGVASPARADVTTPTAGSTVSGNVTVTEARGGSNSCSILGNRASSRIQVTNATTGVEVHTASRGTDGALTTTWSTLGRDNGSYRVRSWTTDSSRSGLSCRAAGEVARSSFLVTVDNRAGVTVTPDASVVSGEELDVAVRTQVVASGISNRAAAGRDVVVTVPGVGERTVRTDANGVAATTFDLPDLPAGEPLPVRAEVVSTPDLRGLQDAAEVRVLPRTSALAYTGDTRAQQGTAADLAARLVDATPGSDRHGDPIAGADVTLAFGSSAATAVTDADGVAERTVVPSGRSRVEDVKATYAGSRVHSGSTDARRFFVGDQAAEEAAVAHDVLGGITRGTTTLLGWLLAPTQQLVDDLAANEPVGQVVDGLNDLLVALGLQPVTGPVLDVADLVAWSDALLAGLDDTLFAVADGADVVVDDVLTNVSLGDDLDALVDVARFRWRSVVADDSGRGDAREFKATVGIPQPLDVTGDGRADVLATLTLASEFATIDVSGVDNPIRVDGDQTKPPGPVVPRLEVARLAGAPADLPLSLQALVDVPGSADQFRFGYDTRESQAPEGFRATLGLADGAVGVELATRGDDPLTVTGAIRPRTSGEAPTGTDAVLPREQRFGISFDHAPRSARLGVDLAGGGQDVAATLGTDEPTEVGLYLADDSGGDEVLLVDARLDAVDGDVGVVVQGDQETGLRAALTSPEGLDAVRIDGAQLDAGDTTTAIELGLTDVPATVDFTLGADGEGGLEASGPIGVFEAGYATGGTVATLEDDAYLRLLEEGEDRTSVAVRLPGFESMSIGLGDDVELGLTMSPTPLAVLVEQPDLTIEGAIEDAPATLSLGLDADGGVEVEGSAPIASVTLSASSPDGIFQGATELDARLTDVPRRLAVEVGEDGVGFDTGGAPIGLVELDAHAGTPVQVPGGGDGLVLQQGGDATALAARIHGLQEVRADLAGAPELLLDTVAREVFRVAITGDAPEDEVRATLDRLVPGMRLALVDDGTGATRLQYRADESTSSLTFALAGLEGSIAGPLPRRLDVCIADDQTCLPAVGIADPALGTMMFETSEYTTLNLRDAEAGITVQDLRLRRLDLTGTFGDDGGPIYLNTTDFAGACGFAGCRYPLQGGRIDADLGDARLEFAPGNGFLAVDATTVLEPTSVLGIPTGLRGKSGTGVLQCVPATTLRVHVRILGINLSPSVRDALCNVTRPPRVQPAG